MQRNVAVNEAFHSGDELDFPAVASSAPRFASMSHPGALRDDAVLVTSCRATLCESDPTLRFFKCGTFREIWDIDRI
jgi:hypothetical protein